MQFRRWAGLCLLCSVWCGQVAASDQWRGPERDGHVDGSQLPAQWPKALQQAWSIPVGEGHATPVVLGDKVFVHSREEEQEVVRAVSLATGKEVWRKSYNAPYEMHSAARGHGKGPKSTPAVTEQALVTLGISGILSAWDPETGRKLWQKNSARDFPKTSPLYGTAASPLITHGLCIAALGGPDQGALAAFELRSGQQRWRTKGTGPAYTSPIVWHKDTVPLIITQTQDACGAFDVGTGHQLWSLPFKTGYDQNSVTPVVFHNLLIFGGFQEPTFAVKPVDGNPPEPVWKNDRIPLYMSTPVVVGEHIYGLTQRDKGQLFCIEGGTGKLLWTGPGRVGDNAAFIYTGRVLLVLTTGGELLVVRPNPEKLDILQQYQVASTPTWAHPVVAGSLLLIKDQTQVTAWRADSR